MRDNEAAALFFLLKKAHLSLVSGASRAVSSAAAVPASQAAALVMLRSVDGCSVRELGKLLGSNSAGTAGLVNRLEKLRLVQRRPSPADARVSQVHLTARGAQVARRAHEALVEVDEELRGLASERDVRAVRRFLEALAARWH